MICARELVDYRVVAVQCLARPHPPPLPEEESSRLSELEDELRMLVGKGGEALREASTWLAHALHGLGRKG